jgi:pyruvate dehydrogenase E2 component (dihydrolipoamide acetyltransferase)
MVPIIRPGQAAALGVGALRQVLAPADSPAKARVDTVATLTLSCDHRVVDGAVGAQWLQHLKALLEKPASMLL